MVPSSSLLLVPLFSMFFLFPILSTLSSFLISSLTPLLFFSAFHPCIILPFPILCQLVLSNLAIYEPRTFESLAVLAKQYAIENGHVFDHESVYIPPPPANSVVLDERVHQIPELIRKFK